MLRTGQAGHGESRTEGRGEGEGEGRSESDGHDGGHRLAHIGALDGLRGVAVAAVLLYHADFSWMRGGHLGVTVFFALSGFLITGLLLREADHRDRIDLRSFWERRIRRLAPASLLAIGLAALYTWAVKPSSAGSVFGDGVAATFWVSNWRFIAEGVSYADVFTAPSPLRHFWSLAVEEHFYLAVPLLVALVTRAAPLRRRRAVLGATLLTVIVTSTVLNALLHPAGAPPLRSYFGTDTRVAEPAVGALLALLLVGRSGVQQLPIVGRRLLDAASGIAAIGLAVMMMRTTVWDNGLYRGGFLLTAVLAAVIVAAASQPATWSARALSASPLRALGRVSYGVYVFHWPVFLWISPSRFELAPVPLFVLRVAATLSIAVASYHLVELPVRLRRFVRLPLPAAVTWANAVVLVVAVLALVGATVASPVRVEMASASLSGGGGDPASLSASSASPEDRVPSLPDAPADQTTDTTVAPTSPSPAAAGTGPRPATTPRRTGGGGGSSTTTVPQPTATTAPVASNQPVATTTPPPPPPLRVAVLGDSVARSLATGITKWGRRNNVSVLDVTVLGCPIAYDGERRFADGYPWPIPDDCPRWADPANEWSQRLREFDPDVVVVEDGVNEAADRKLAEWSDWFRPGVAVYDSWLAGQYRSLFETINASSTPVMLLNAPCADLSDWGDAARMSDVNERVVTLNGSVYDKLGNEGSNRILDLFTEVCPDGKYSNTLYGESGARPDGLHFSERASEMIADRLIGPAVLAAAGRA